MAELNDNPFEILGVAASSAVTDEVVREAWRSAAFECHPDHNQDDPDAGAKFTRVQLAYESLKTADLRAAAARKYGMALEVRSRAGMRSSFDGFFDSMDVAAEKWKRRPYASAPADGRSVTREMSISLEQAFRGGSFQIDHKEARCGRCHGAGRIHTRFPMKCPTCAGDGSIRAAEGMIRVKLECTTCLGRGKVTWEACDGCGGAGQIAGVSAVVEVPAGVDTGFEIKLPGLGMPGVSGGRPGDLAVSLRVMEDRVFQRRNEDLLVRLPVDVWDAALGATKKVKGVDGRTLEFGIPAGCRTGLIISLRGEGMSTLAGVRGNLLVKVDVVVPEAKGRMRDLFLAMRDEASGDDPVAGLPDEDAGDQA